MYGSDVFAQSLGLNGLLQVRVIHIYYSFDTGEYHKSVGLVFTRVPQE